MLLIFFSDLVILKVILKKYVILAHKRCYSKHLRITEIRIVEIIDIFRTFVRTLCSFVCFVLLEISN